MHLGFVVALATVWVGVGAATLPSHPSHDQYSPPPPNHPQDFQDPQNLRDQGPQRISSLIHWGLDSSRLDNTGVAGSELLGQVFGEDQDDDFQSEEFRNEDNDESPNSFNRKLPYDDEDFLQNNNEDDNQDDEVIRAPEDSFAADDNFQDQGPGSLEIYKLDLSKDKAALMPIPHMESFLRTKSKTPKKVSSSQTNWKLNSYNNFPSVPFKDEVFGVGGVPELQVGCEGLEAFQRQKRASENQQVPKSSKTEDHQAADTRVTNDKSLEQSYSEYEDSNEEDVLLALLNVKSTTPSRGDIPPGGEYRAPDPSKLRGDLGNSSRSLLRDDQHSNKMNAAPNIHRQLDLLMHADESATKKSSGNLRRKLLSVEDRAINIYSSRNKRSAPGQRSPRESYPSSVQYDAERMRQEYAKRLEEQNRRNQIDSTSESYAPRSREDIQRNYEYTRSRQGQPVSPTWEEMRRREEQQRRSEEDRRRQEERIRRQEEERRRLSERQYEPNPLRPENDRRRQEEERRRQEELWRQQEEIRRYQLSSATAVNYERRREEEERRRQVEERRRQEEERRRQEEERKRQEEERRRLQGRDSRYQPSNLERPNSQPLEYDRSRSEDERRRNEAEQEERRRQQIKQKEEKEAQEREAQLQKYLKRIRPIRVKRPNVPESNDIPTHLSEAEKRERDRRTEEMRRREEYNKRIQERSRQEEARNRTQWNTPVYPEEGRQRPSASETAEYKRERERLEAERRAAERNRQLVLKREEERRRQQAAEEAERGRQSPPANIEQKNGRLSPQEEEFLNSLPVSARIIIQEPQSNHNVRFGSRGGFPEENNSGNSIAFTGNTPDVQGLRAHNFPVPPTPEPPREAPGPCAWAIIHCCSSNAPNRRLPSCFEGEGCPGIQWDKNACNDEVVQGARKNINDYYNFRGN